MPEAAAAEPGRGRPGPLPWLAAGVVGVAGAVLLPALLEALQVAGPAGICPSRRLLGLPCPGCGMTRALVALLAGDLAGAFALHPWAPVLAAQAALGWAAWGWSLWSGQAARRLAAAIGPVLLANLAALVALWLGRLATGTLP